MASSKQTLVFDTKTNTFKSQTPTSTIKNNNTKAGTLHSRTSVINSFSKRTTKKCCGKK